MEISAEWCFYKPTRNIHFSNKTRVSELQHVLYNLFVGIIQTWGMFYSDLKVLETGGDSGCMVTWYSLIWKVVLKRNWKSRNVVEKRRAGGKLNHWKYAQGENNPLFWMKDYCSESFRRDFHINWGKSESLQKPAYVCQNTLELRGKVNKEISRLWFSI